MTLISPDACHNPRRGFPGRPRAGTEPWDWYWGEWSRKSLLYTADIKHRLGQTQWTAEKPFITLHYRLTAIQRREVIAHEMHHLALGGVCTTLCPQNEERVTRATARWLLPDFRPVAEALRHYSIGRVATDFQVTRALIYDRLHSLTRSEKPVIAAIMGKGPDWVPVAIAAQPVLAAAMAR